MLRRFSLSQQTCLFLDFTEKLQANTGDVNITENLRNSDMVSSEDIFTASNVSNLFYNR